MQARQSTSIGDVRGRGAMIAVELVEPAATTDPNAALTGAHRQGLPRRRVWSC